MPVLTLDVVLDELPDLASAQHAYGIRRQEYRQQQTEGRGDQERDHVSMLPDEGFGSADILRLCKAAVASSLSSNGIFWPAIC